MLIHLHVYLWLYLATMVEVSSYNRSGVAHKTKNIYHQVLYKKKKKGLLTPGLNDKCVCICGSFTEPGIPSEN